MKKETKKRGHATFDICLIALMSALMCVCSWLTIPTTVPFTMQTFAIFITLLIMPDVKGLVSIVIYVLLGATGLPVFSGFQGGMGKLLGPTGGYIFGFIACGCLYLFLIKLLPKKGIIRLTSLFSGLILCYFVGTLWFVHITGNGVISSVTICVFPFIIPDTAKLLLAYTISKRIKTGHR